MGTNLFMFTILLDLSPEVQSLASERLARYLASVMRFLLIILVMLSCFGGGFYAGVRHHEAEMVKNPEKFISLHAERFNESAKDKVEKVKDFVREKLP